MERLETDEGFETASRLLQSFGLPTEDLRDEQVSLWCHCEGRQLNSMAGLEVYGEVALLRSLAVRPDLQGAGEASSCLKTIETEAKAQGVRELYLLTNSAEAFFAKRGFAVVARDVVPDVIKATSQFSSLCPDSATVMKKVLPG